MLRCACPTRFNVLKRTPQLVERSRALRLKLFEQRVIKLSQQTREISSGLKEAALNSSAGELSA